MGVPPRPTIVYAEDEPAVQRLVQFWLEDAGYDVLLAGDGAEGLALTHAHRPDLVITDALMPNLTGDELVELLQADPDLRHIPIVMATAAASPVRVRKMLGLGCRAVVAKPLDEETFLAAVRDALLP
ncbi:MAG TPA: response regulator [Acidimicrobiales bacterium]|nr:response regulator [Acidimicrobiales bacterium]